MSTEPCGLWIWGWAGLGSGDMQMKEVQFLLVTTREALELRAGKWLLQRQKRDAHC